MNRRIAAIFAADVAGFSTLVAEDEEDALRRLKAYRAVIDDFIHQFGGKIFNTAGDSVMASFPSAVDAVRCSIDIQESLRTRNRAYPESRHMMFRIGINIGDVVERDDDLLGDGVNLAARLQGLAMPGGVCVSRSVHEQVVGKLSVGFEDLGEQLVKNIATPVQVYGVAWREDAPVRGRSRRKTLTWYAAVSAFVSIAAVAGYVGLRGRTTIATTAPVAQPIAPQSKAAVATPLTAPVALPAKRVLVFAAIPFLATREQQKLADLYAPTMGSKAIAIGRLHYGHAVGAVDEEAAKTIALQHCEARAKAAGYNTPCEVYAVGDRVVWPHLPPPLPPRPWVKRDASTDQPLTLELIRRIRPSVSERSVTAHLASKSNKFVAAHPKRRGGSMDFYTTAGTETDVSMRAVLDLCGHIAKEPCIIVAIGDTVVVPVPMTSTVVGLFRAATHPAISSDHRDPLERRLAGSPSGWSAVVVGASGQPAAAFGHSSELQAISSAVDECGRRDRDCKVIAIGPFSVEPAKADANKVETGAPGATKPAADPARDTGQRREGKDPETDPSPMEKPLR